MISMSISYPSDPIYNVHILKENHGDGDVITSYYDIWSDDFDIIFFSAEREYNNNNNDLHRRTDVRTRLGGRAVHIIIIFTTGCRFRFIINIIIVIIFM